MEQTPIREPEFDYEKMAKNVFGVFSDPLVLLADASELKLACKNCKRLFSIRLAKKHATFRCKCGTHIIYPKKKRPVKLKITENGISRHRLEIVECYLHRFVSTKERLDNEGKTQTIVQ